MRKILLVIAVVLLASLACNFNMGKSTGGEIRMDEAGFSAVIPPGYQMSSVVGELGAVKDGADALEGPNFSVSVSPSNSKDDANDILDSLSGPNNVFNYAYSGVRVPVTVGGQPGLAEDFTGVTESGVAIAGRDLVAILPDGRQVLVSGHWPVDQQEQAEQVFQSILNSIKFYAPVPPTAEP